MIKRGVSADYFILGDVQERREVLNIPHPIEKRLITNWDDMETLWDYTFSKVLKKDPTEYTILLTESPLPNCRDRETMAEIMSETFQAPAIYVSNQAALALYASGRITGIVTDLGKDIIHTVPVYEGHPLAYSTNFMDFGGDEITRQLQLLLSTKNRGSENMIDATYIKEQAARVASNAHIASEELNPEAFQLPDGTTIMLGAEKFQCSEILFQPQLYGFDTCSLAQHTYNSILQCDTDTRRHWYHNIILSGCSSLLPGLQERFTHEMTRISPSRMRVGIKAIPERGLLTWIGGSIFGSLSPFETMKVTQAEMEEWGYSIINRRCW
eukprot:TRINITY_DN16453_c0_g1_i1.p1 TRINITY_DN16453_c0_g1~~TRINITY_DN16453_c0_g1_i1.p1  ORF type:complete len:326 (-),score=40.48 TRINITY_DN16453_c0_g1_i1:161-1138(-)